MFNVKLITGQACSNSPCENNGLCIEKEDTFFCQCPFNFFGDRCQYKSSCSSSVCKMGATCMNDLSSPNGYKCICQQGNYFIFLDKENLLIYDSI